VGPLAARLARGHTVVVPDLRGMGLSSHPAGGYDKKTQAGDVAAVLDTLKIDKVDLVTTTSETWSATPSQRANRDASRNSPSWMHRCRASAHGRDPEESAALHFRSAAQIWNAGQGARADYLDRF